ncbi:MAG TPA: hypothetical protein VKA10_06065 [Prolixibacteraceae bacterium]|nr:hypothetical protein [Prolixibacteraceae bacterium]
MKKLALVLFATFIMQYINAQRTTEIGFTGGAIRFYPDLEEKFSTSKNDAMDNGWGFSAGVFLEDHWKPRIHQIVELNYINLNSDVFLEYNPVGSGGYGGANSQNSWKNFGNVSFNYIAISGGTKLFLNKKLFVYPGIEWARILTNEVDLNKSTYHLKLAAGFNSREFDVILEYNYGLKYQRRVYSLSPPLLGTHTNNFLQLKVQIPFYSLR